MMVKLIAPRVCSLRVGRVKVWNMTMLRNSGYLKIKLHDSMVVEMKLAMATA